MKTAISMDDDLMRQADAVARDLGLSRSGFIAEAVAAYLKSRRQARIARQLNEAYANDPTPGERNLTRNLKSKLPRPDRW